MNQPNRQNIYINENPEGKIRFLETALVDEDWRATIVFPANDPVYSRQLAQTDRALQRRGYITQTGKDAAGNTTLEIHHLGKDTKLSEILQEAGLKRAIGHTFEHPLAPVRTPMKYGGKAVDWLVGSLHDPARANGVINTTSEIFLTAAGPTAKTGKLTDAKNLLQTFAGLNWLSQSLVFLVFGKNNEARAFDRIESKLDRSLKRGEDITQLRYNDAQDCEPDTFMTRAHAFVKRYPVQIGAMLNNVGMLAYMGHAWFERKYHLNVLNLRPSAEAVESAEKYVGVGAKGIRNWLKTGFGKDIFGACLSLAGWTVLMIPPAKPRPDLDNDDQESLLARGWRKFREHTPFAAGLFTLGASSFRLMGANSKGNITQQIGEKIYIGGDIALMFTNSHEYGGDAKLHVDKLSEKLVAHVATMPVLLGKQEQADFANHIVQYWIDKHQADLKLHAKNHRMPRELVDDSAAEMRQRLARQIHHQQTERLEHLAECVGEIIVRFPQVQHQALMDKLTDTLTAMPWMKAKPAELKQAITTSLQRLPRPVSASISEKAIAKDVAAISGIVPNIDRAACSAALYDVLSTFTRAQQPSATVSNISRVAPVQSPLAPQLSQA